MKAEQSDRSDTAIECSIELVKVEPRLRLKGSLQSPEELASSSGDAKAVYCAGYLRGMTDGMKGHGLPKLQERVRALDRKR